MPADSAAAVVKFTISIPRESCTNAKAKYSSSVMPPDPSVHFYHCFCLGYCLSESVLSVVLYCRQTLLICLLILYAFLDANES